MGFFDSSQTVESSSTYDNPELRSYTTAYRGAAPFAFASLDPAATLAAMRVPGVDLGLGGKKGRAALTPELKKQAATEEQEREAANAGLERIAERQKSGQFLTSKETEFINTQLDKAFEYAHKTGYEDWQKATSFMAGSRGLRMSDTPAAEPALRELRNFEVGLGSKRAEMGLEATLQFSKNQQDFDANFSSMLKQLGQNRWATRQGFLFGGGLQGASNLGFTTKGTQTSSGSMSSFGKIMSGISMASAGLNLAKDVGGMFTGMGALPGSGGGSTPAQDYSKQSFY